MPPNTRIDGVDYGPLAALAGSWKGDKGLDLSPEPDGEASTPFFETLLFEPIGTATNAERQILAVLRYHQVVSRVSNRTVFHNETGYWMWDAAAGIVMQSLAIPGAVCLLAGGKADVRDRAVVIEVKATMGGRDWGILQSPFMRDNARTVGFRHRISVEGDALSYSESTMLEIYGRSFEHTDENALTRET